MLHCYNIVKHLNKVCEQYQKAQIKGRAELILSTATASSVHAQQKVKNAITGMDWIATLHYVDILNRGKTALSGPLADPAIGNIANADKVVVPLAGTGSHATEVPVLPTHVDHHISQENREALLDLSKWVTLHLVTDTSPEGKLHMDVASDGHTSFHTTLQMVTKQGSKPLPVKVDPGADVNTIPLTKYRKLFPVHFTKAGNLKQKALHPTRHAWTVHDETHQQFLGYFIADIYHKTIPEVP